MKFLILFFLLSSGALAFADNYQRGAYICESFRRAEQNHRRHPDSVDLRMGYAHCLLTRGEDGDHQEALSILHHIADRHNNVNAAFVIAEYIGSGGTFEDTIDYDNLNEAIAAYARVLFFIDLDPDYPPGMGLYEAESQMELRSSYRHPLLYFEKFTSGALGTENSHLLKSPSYDGEKDLKTYPEYSPYTMDSLRKTVRFSNRCVALPKKRHFLTEQYKKSRAGCQVLGKVAEALLPMEEKRLDLLADKSCSGDLPKCSEYYDLRKKMVAILERVTSDLNKIFS